MRRATVMLVRLVAAALLARCKSSTEPVPASIVVTPVSLLLEVAASRQLTVRAFDGAGNEIANPKVVFVSTNEAVAQVDDEGRVGGVASGSCQVIVLAAANSQVAVAVPTTVVTRFDVDITPAEAVLTPGATLLLSARVTDDNGQAIVGVPITWSSTNSGVVSVTTAGTAQGVALGYANVVATAGLQGRDTAAIIVLHRIAVPGGAYGLDVAPNRLALVTLGNAMVARIDLATRTVTGTIAVGSAPTQVAFHTAHDSAYVTNQLSRNVGVLDVVGGAQVGSVAVPADPFVVDVSPNGAFVYVTGNEGSVFVIDAATRALDTALFVGGSPNGLAFHPTNPVLYVSTFQTGSVIEVNTAAHTLGREFSVGGLPQGLALSPDGEELYVANESYALVHVLRTATGAMIGTVPLPGGAFGLALSPDGTTLYAGVPGAVAVINRAGRTLVRVVPVGGTPRRISFDPGTGRAVVANAAGWVDILP
ncbi:MAG: Ig-like domain-containing protein [Gemmatimonadales bacterium]